MDTFRPSITIIIPCFNRWPHVREAIDSVLAQSWPETRCLLVDDASTDESLQQLQQHYRDASRVTIVSLSHNQGQSAARNAGAQLSDSDYVGFLDSDDLLTASAVETRMQLALEHPGHDGMLVGDKLDEHTGRSRMPAQKPVGQTITLSEYVEKRGWIHTNSFLIRRDAFLALGGFDPELRKKEDIEFFLRALCQRPALYAGGRCCVVRGVDNQRARHDHRRIIEQGRRFSHKLRHNASLMAALTTAQLRKLEQGDLRSSLHSLYRAREFPAFRRVFHAGLKEGSLSLDGRLLKRYLLSWRIIH